MPAGRGAGSSGHLGSVAVGCASVLTLGDVPEELQPLWAAQGAGAPMEVSCHLGWGAAAHGRAQYGGMVLPGHLQNPQPCGPPARRCRSSPGRAARAPLLFQQQLLPPGRAQGGGKQIRAIAASPHASHRAKCQIASDIAREGGDKEPSVPLTPVAALMAWAAGPRVGTCPALGAERGHGRCWGPCLVQLAQSRLQPQKLSSSSSHGNEEFSSPKVELVVGRDGQRAGMGSGQVMLALTCSTEAPWVTHSVGAAGLVGTVLVWWTWCIWCCTGPRATEILGAEHHELFHGINVEETGLDNND